MFQIKLSQSPKQTLICLVKALTSKKMLLMRISDLFFDSHLSTKEDAFICRHIRPLLTEKKCSSLHDMNSAFTFIFGYLFVF